MKTILSATNKFTPDAKLGEGGFGEVYKGMLHGSFVAVKCLSIVSQCLCYRIYKDNAVH